jgi:hypothetical protein
MVIGHDGFFFEGLASKYDKLARSEEADPYEAYRRNDPRW